MLSNQRVQGVLGMLLVAAVLLLASCSEEPQEHIAPAINPHDSVSTMTSYGVNTLISDSGVIKYRIVTERWDVNTIRMPNRWEFMKGVFFEQFDEQFHVQAYIQADTAWYYDKLKLWKLRGRVRIRNNNGLLYRSEELYWDGIRHELYSNVFSKVTSPERTLQGTYFRSDERMTKYTVSNSKGAFVPDDKTDEDSGTAQEDSTFQAPVRPAARKHARTPLVETRTED
ncbi:MAG: LPS export ABC transporter periplasmic protein LptC [Prevotella sp.]|nr:LPS export ABC transporter periplasmic protein LptC [Prevotella sp.]